jgi:hypothetical protein
MLLVMKLIVGAIVLARLPRLVRGYVLKFGNYYKRY